MTALTCPIRRHSIVFRDMRACSLRGGNQHSGRDFSLRFQARIQIRWRQQVPSKRRNSPTKPDSVINTNTTSKPNLIYTRQVHSVWLPSVDCPASWRDHHGRVFLLNHKKSASRLIPRCIGSSYQRHHVGSTGALYLRGPGFEDPPKDRTHPFRAFPHSFYATTGAVHQIRTER
jgi:hypothetical protein